MPSFPNRRGLPSCREEASHKRKCRGRRPGAAVPCGRRLAGWIENVARRSTTWGDVDLEAFCRKTGYSREHTTRELSKIRRERSDLVFETKLRRRRRGRPAAWGVIVCEESKLRFDRCSLFYGCNGKPLHNYTTLAPEGRKLEPPAPPIKRVELTPTAAKIAEAVCDNPLKKKDSFGIQQPDSYGARRDVAQSRDEEDPPPRRRPGRARLVRKAFGLLRRLEGCHYDNCKVTFSRRAAHCYALRALIDGHDQERIVRCYEEALFVCHGFAVDRSASAGKVIFFNPSSTVSKARRLLAKDGLDRHTRVRKWYDRNPRRESADEFPTLSLDEIRAQIAATFPRD